jgi:hypothetical protein
MDRQLDIEPMAKPKWRRWSYRAFVIVNVAGIIVAIPLIVATVPLLKIWWDTRSQESLIRREIQTHNNSPKTAVTTVESRSSTQAPPPATPELPSLSALTNQLSVVGNLKEDELDKIVAYKFGAKKRSEADPTKFDSDSAVLHKISRSIATVSGKAYYCYQVDLVDENGNHKTNTEYYEKPDLDYERGMATLELVNNNPQLKKIYNAFAHVLAEKSAEPADKDAAIRTDGKALPKP